MFQIQFPFALREEADDSRNRYPLGRFVLCGRQRRFSWLFWLLWCGSSVSLMANRIRIFWKHGFVTSVNF